MCMDWVLDSGATHHITPHKEAFWELGNRGKEIRALEGQAQAVGEGTVRLRASQPGQSKQLAEGEPMLELRNVLWVPSAPCSLLSEVRLQRVGGTLRGAGDSRQFVLPGGVSVRGTLSGSSGLFGFRAECVLPTAALGMGALRQPADACAQLWHRRLGHLSSSSMQQVIRMVHGMDLTLQQAGAVSDALCPECAASKQHRRQHTGSQQPARELLERLHTDVMGPLLPSLPQLGDARYVVTVLDDWSGMCALQPVALKGEACRVVQEVVKLWENSTGKKVKQLRSDRGGEYVSKDIQQWCASKGIQQQLTPPYTPEMNGKAERLNRTLMERVRAMLEEAQLPGGFWPEAVRAAAHVIVRSPAAGRAATPLQLFSGQPPSVAHLRVFGAAATVLVPRQQRTKVDMVSQRGVMVGYARQGAGWRVWVPDRMRVVESVDVLFDERPVEQRGRPAHQAAAAPGPPLLCQEDAYGVGSTGSSGMGGLQHWGRAATAPTEQQGGPAAQGGEVGAAAGAPQHNAQQAAVHGDGAPPQPPPEPPPAQHIEAAEGAQIAPVSGAGSPPQPPPEPPPAHGENEHEAAGHEQPHEQAQQQPQPPQQQGVRRSTRERRQPAHLQGTFRPYGHGQWAANVAVSSNAGDDGPCVALVAAGEVPQSRAEAASAPDREQWFAAMDEEMSALEANSTWELLPLPPGARPLQLRWVLSVKEGEHGQPRHKARLVAKGCAQRPWEHGELYAPVAMAPTLRCLLAKVAAEDLELHQLDICTAFLNGELGEEVWVQQPEGYQQGSSNMALRLRRALYGLKQAPRAWHEKLAAVLSDLGFAAAGGDPSMYVRHGMDGSTWLLVYVDDMLVAAKQLSEVQRAKQEVMGRFKARDLGEASCYLGLEIKRDRAARTLTVHQSRYAQGVLRKFGMEAGSQATPLKPGVQLSREQGVQLSHSRYAELVGCLQYAAQHTRPDLAHATGVLARFMAAPTDQHWAAALGVLRYLLATRTLGIVYGGESSSPSKPEGFADADYAGCPDTRRSTSGYVFMLHGGAVSWKSKRQACVTTSTAEAEYVAAVPMVQEGLWLKQLQSDLQLGSRNECMQLYTDNAATLRILHNPVQTRQAKHIDIQLHFARERALRGDVRFSYCPTERNLADCMTKALQPVRFEHLRAGMGMHSMESN